MALSPNKLKAVYIHNSKYPCLKQHLKNQPKSAKNNQRPSKISFAFHFVLDLQAFTSPGSPFQNCHGKYYLNYR